MRRRTSIWAAPSAAVVALCALTAAMALGAEDATTTDERIDLKLIYFGHPGSERERDFVSFLDQHFKAVTTGDLAQFQAARAQAADVVILDYDGDGFKAPRPRIPRGALTRPTVTVGVAGALICGAMGLKTGYL